MTRGRHERNGRNDLTELLGLSGIGARLVLALYLVVVVTLAVTAGAERTRTPAGLIALLAVIAASVLVVAPAERIRPVLRSVVAIGAVALSSALVLAQLPGTGPVGYAAWHILANTMILLALALRGQPVAAWIGFAAMAAVTAIWATISGYGMPGGLFLLARESTALAVGTLFSIGLSRLAANIRRYSAVEVRELAREEHALAALREREAQVARIDALARPSLEAIANQPGSASEQQAQEYLLLEGRLRDSIRARAFDREPLLSTVREARRRGVDVHLLDDTDLPELTEAQSERIAVWTAQQIAASVSEHVVARLVLETADAGGQQEELVASVVSNDVRSGSRSELRLVRER